MTIKWRILVVEDDQALALGLRINLEAEGYEVIHVITAEEGISILESSSIDLVVLDIMLPGITGIEALEQIRGNDPRLPVLILTAKSSPDDKVEGLRAGADDYLTKPFHLEEFLLRVKRILNRYEWYKSEDILKIGETRLDFNTLEITTPSGEICRVTPHEANLIQYLAVHQDRIVSRGELLKNVWGLDPDMKPGQWTPLSHASGAI